MATSVPDTIISLRDARDGDYDDAVANALGSNIFDICFALGFPLFLFTLIYGPIQMSAETIEQSGELRFILLGLTLISALAFLIGKKIKSPQGTKLIGLGRGNAYFLLSLYAVFLVYIIGRAYNAAWTQTVSASINSFLEILPQLN
jgi:Ca2+/Na+ antiporter